MGLMEKFADPALFDSLSFSEKMGGSAITMLMGMGITFVILCILWGFVVVMGKTMDAVQKKNKAAGTAQADALHEVVSPGAATGETAAVAGIAADAQAQADDEVIAAVIAAAVCAYQESGGTGNLVVKKISRVSGGTNPWVSAAWEECMQSRKI